MMLYTKFQGYHILGFLKDFLKGVNYIHTCMDIVAIFVIRPGLKVIKYLCSTLLSMKFILLINVKMSRILLINVKMPTIVIVGILT